MRLMTHGLTSLADGNPAQQNVLWAPLGLVDATVKATSIDAVSPDATDGNPAPTANDYLRRDGKCTAEINMTGGVVT